MMPDLSRPSGVAWHGGLRWYAVITNPKCEFRADFGLKAKGFETFCPKLRKRIRHARYTNVVERPLFARYVFVRFDMNFGEWFHPITSTDGVEELVSNNHIPMRIPDEQLQPLIDAYRGGEFDYTRKPRIICDWHPDEQVRISDGVFSGFNARILAVMPERERAEVLLSFFRRHSKIELDFVQLEKMA